jgi:hypothetical protein
MSSQTNFYYQRYPVSPQGIEQQVYIKPEKRMQRKRKPQQSISHQPHKKQKAEESKEHKISSARELFKPLTMTSSQKDEVVDQRSQKIDIEEEDFDDNAFDIKDILDEKQCLLFPSPEKTIGLKSEKQLDRMAKYCAFRRMIRDAWEEMLSDYADDLTWDLKPYKKLGDDELNSCLDDLRSRFLDVASYAWDTKFTKKGLPSCPNCRKQMAECCCVDYGKKEAPHNFEFWMMASSLRTVLVNSKFSFFHFIHG